MQTVTIATCTAFNAAGNCSATSYMQAVILEPTDSAVIQALTLGMEFSAPAFELALGGMISLFIVGLSVGWIVSIIRKLR